jgi:hypothetical protein
MDRLSRISMPLEKSEIFLDLISSEAHRTGSFSNQEIPETLLNSSGAFLDGEAIGVDTE